MFQRQFQQLGFEKIKPRIVVEQMLFMQRCRRGKVRSVFTDWMYRRMRPALFPLGVLRLDAALEFFCLLRGLFYAVEKAFHLLEANVRQLKESPNQPDAEFC